MMDSRVVVKQEARMLLNAESVASLLDLSPSVVYDLIKDGRLASVLIPGTARRRVPMHKLREFVQECVKLQIDDPAALRKAAPLDQGF